MSPFELIEKLVGQYTGGQMADEQFRAALNQVEIFVKGFAAQLDQMQAPGDEGENVKRLSKSCIDLFMASIAQLREAGTGGAKSLCAEALEKANQGELLVNEILTRTAS